MTHTHPTLRIFLTAIVLLLSSTLVKAQTIELANKVHIELRWDNTAEVTSSPDASGNIIIPQSVTHEGKTYTITQIGSFAFYNNQELTSVELPKTIKKIEDYAFGWSGLTKINGQIPALDNLGINVFENTPWLDNLISNTKENQFVYFGNWIIANTYDPFEIYDEIHIKDGVVGFADDLKSLPALCVYIPKSLTNIQTSFLNGNYQAEKFVVDKDNPTFLSDEYGAIYYRNHTTSYYSDIDDTYHEVTGKMLYLYPTASKVDTFNVAAGTKAIMSNSCCETTFKAIIIPEGIEAIENNAFYYSRCTLFDLPSSIKSISFAFHKLALNAKIIMRSPNIPSSDKYDNFDGCKKITAYVPNNALEDYKEFFESHEYGTFIVKSFDEYPKPLYHKTDVNHDGITNSVDVVAIYNYIFSGNDSGISKSQFDVNGDGTINSADITEIYNYIIGSK